MRGRVSRSCPWRKQAGSAVRGGSSGDLGAGGQFQGVWVGRVGS